MARFAAVGAGRMGRSIAIAFAYAGHRVSLIDLRQRSAADLDKLRQDAQAEILASLSSLSKLQAFDDSLVEQIAARVDFVDAQAAPAALAQAELVFEGVPEQMQAKREAFEQINRCCREDAILT